ncbi:cytochrome P450 [Hypomontagnella monticulosa]|nr:cytochrome P450 [Hypomontagnella monticulosa]
MAPLFSVALGGLAATYLFLRFLLYLTQDPREPPAIVTRIPFISPLIGMITQKSSYYNQLRDAYKLPIYTLRLPFSRMYVVNATELIPALQKQWRTVSFAAIAADAGHLVGMSKEATEVMRRDLTSEHGFSVSWPKYIAPIMSPGKDLDELNRKAIEVFVEELGKLKTQGSARTGLWQWTSRTMDKSTSEAVWGPQNPYRDPVVAEAWKIFEAGFLTLSVFPLARYFYPRLVRARELVASAMTDYMHKGGHETASGLVRKRYEHHRQFGLSHEDIARGELGNTFAVLSSTTPCALWVLYYIFSDSGVLEEIREEVSALVRETVDEEKRDISSIDLANIRTSCPVLLSTFQEVMRYRTVTPGPRVLLDDVLLDGRILLKKGNMLMIPASVQHTNVSAWGEDAGNFNHMRFVPGSGQKKPNRVAFRAFGGGHVLCPGRHFASTEIMALAALLVLQFDVVPLAGKWVEPTWKNSPMQAGFPIPDEDINVEFRPREPGRVWQVVFSAADEAMGIVSEDVAASEE